MSDDPTISEAMTEEEIQRMLGDLKKKGAEPGAWGKTVPGKHSHPFVERQKASLESMKKVFEAQVQQDQEQIEALQEMLQRLKHGGGSYRG
jgi:hypothetical protein